MATLTIRNLPDEVQAALKARAVGHGCSTEEEVRRLLKAAVAPQGPGFGTQLTAIAKRAHFTDAEINRMQAQRAAGLPRSVGVD